MSKVAQKRISNKALTVSERDQVYAGLDVHKKSIHVAVWLNERVERHWVMPAEPARVLAKMAPLRVALKRVVYEAGPTGYRLARVLRAAGLPVEVVAPSKTPRAADRSAKSDRLDCFQLAEYAAKGLLRAVAIPSEQEEADRQVVRLRDQLMCKQRRVKQQIKSLLLQYGLAEPEGLKHWSDGGVQRLRELPLGGELRFCLDSLLAELDHLREQVLQVNRRVEELSRQERHGAALAVLTSHPGVGTIIAMTFRTELHQAERFSDGGQVAQYLGLAPRVSQSGGTRRDGPICKTGRGYLRALLIQGAWQWVYRDPAAQEVYNRLLSHTGNGQKAIVGLARRLAVHLWRMLTTGELYRAAA
jgi:transposase